MSKSSLETNVCVFNPEVGREFSVTNIPSISRNVTFVKDEVTVSQENFTKVDPTDTEGCDKDSGSSAVSPDPCSDLDNSDLYDTDLDVIELKDDDENEDQFIGREVYTNACESCDYFSPHRTILRDMGKRCMDLSYRNLGPRGIKPLTIGLLDNLRVEELVLEGNDIQNEGCRHVAQLLLENLVLSRVNLSSNSLGYEAAWCLSIAVGRSKTLQHLNLSENKLNDDAIVALSKGIAKNDSILTLNLSKNTFGEEGAKALGAAIAENNRLQELYANWNFIRGSGAVGICKSFKENTTLRTLHIAWNGLGYEGSVAISDTLKSNSTLKELDISNNRLNWKCADLIAKGLRVNTTLEILKIGDNPLTTTGAMDIVSGVSHGKCKIRLLDMINVSVLPETELQAMTIENKRKFKLIHGGVVRTHDPLGEKKEREVKAIERILDYMKTLGLRPVEMLRDFDKTVNYQVTQQDFIKRLKQKKIPLHNFEMVALAEAIADRGKGEDHIDYRKLIDAVKQHVVEERNVKIKERTKKQKTKAYHKRLLDLKLPSEVLSEPEIDEQEEMDRVGEIRAPSVLTHSYSSIMSASTVQRSTSILPSLKSISREGDRTYRSLSSSGISMCGPLDQPLAKRKTKKKKRSHTLKVKSY